MNFPPLFTVIGAGAFFAAAWVLSRMGGPSSFGERAAAIAKSVIGLGATSNVQRFADFLGGPGEAQATSMAMATAPQSSTCGLVLGAIWRAAGVKDKRLAPPYIIATAISRLVAMLQEVGGWRTDVASYEPQPGDGMFLDVDKPSAHVNMIVGVEKTATGWILQTVDGGVVDMHGKQMIAGRVHTLTRHGFAMASMSSIGVAHNVIAFGEAAKLAKLAA